MSYKPHYQVPIRSVGEELRERTNALPKQGTAQAIESAVAQRLLHQRHQREKLLGPELAGEPAWTMLLNLFVAYEEGRRAAVLKLCTEAGTRPDVALRWLLTLAAEGKVIWRSKAKDPYAARVDLAPEMANQLRALFRSWLRGSI
jgi:predicted Rossmann fold nucleotide-binding protein DprA/Smf involved in DNA uptake